MPFDAAKEVQSGKMKNNLNFDFKKTLSLEDYKISKLGRFWSQAIEINKLNRTKIRDRLICFSSNISQIILLYISLPDN
jgi:hypothetical protein